MGSPAVLFDRLLSHRLRGFSAHEGSLAGLRAALAAEVAWIEIDTRTTADGTVLVFHDSRLDRLTGETGRVADYDVADAGRPRFRGSPDERVPTLEEFLGEFAARRGATRLMMDIKDAGGEEQLCHAVAAAGLDRAVWVISWSPQILRRVHELAPRLRLGFSHVPLTRWRPALLAGVRLLGRGRFLRAVGRLFALLGADHDLQDTVCYLDEYNGAEDPLERARGSFPVHFASGLVKGGLAEILRRTGGGVGTPASMLTPDYVAAAHGKGLAVFVYSLDRLEAARAAIERCDVDVIFTNEARLFARALSER